MEESDEEVADLVAPFGRTWPGLAPAREFEADPDVGAAEVAASVVEAGWLKDPRAALVPGRRSADIPAAIGWTGPCNHEYDVARLCSVLRSWEDRFGVRVVALAFDVLVLSVAAPPATVEEAEAVAAEHFAFCPDNVTQESDSLRAYAESLVDAPAWSSWWDSAVPRPGPRDGCPSPRWKDTPETTRSDGSAVEVPTVVVAVVAVVPTRVVPVLTVVPAAVTPPVTAELAAAPASVTDVPVLATTVRCRLGRLRHRRRRQRCGAGGSGPAQQDGGRDAQRGGESGNPHRGSPFTAEALVPPHAVDLL